VAPLSNSNNDFTVLELRLVKALQLPLQLQELFSGRIDFSDQGHAKLSVRTNFLRSGKLGRGGKGKSDNVSRSQINLLWRGR
jgi:hypothetical protein